MFYDHFSAHSLLAMVKHWEMKKIKHCTQMRPPNMGLKFGGFHVATQGQDRFVLGLRQIKCVDKVGAQRLSNIVSTMSRLGKHRKIIQLQTSSKKCTS